VRPGWAGKCVGTLRPLRKMISQTKFRCDVNNTRRAVGQGPSGQVAREVALFEFRRDYSRAYRCRCWFSASSLARLKFREPLPQASFQVFNADHLDAFLDRLAPILGDLFDVEVFWFQT
jgi:hypothetical protein